MGDNFIERKNRLKQEFYKLFSVPEFVECSVIDMVLQQCNYDADLTYEQLADMSNQRPDKTNLDASSNVTRSLSFVPGTPPPAYSYDPLEGPPQAQPLPQFKPLNLYPSLPQVADDDTKKKDKSEGKKDQAEAASDGNINKDLLTLIVKLELLRVIGAKKKDDIEREKVDPRIFPKYWPRTDRSVSIIPPVNEELKKAITERFTNVIRKMPFQMEILSIEELCNFKIYGKFIQQKSILKRLDKEPNEMTVWYPSRDEYVEDICHKGIDFDMDISTGPIGKGKYFFRSAYEAHERKASKRYKNGERAYMFLCEVLIGDSQKGEPNQEGVPRHRNGVPYETTVDSFIRSDLFIVHHKDNCYPRYLVTYTAKDVP